MGQERDFYRSHGLTVVWIEPLPRIFQILDDLMVHYKKQSAYKYLVTDVDDKEYVFHVTDNSGESSSIFELARHKDVWPWVKKHHELKIKSITLPSLLEKEGIDINLFDALVMDTQGSELLVLKGAEKLLQHFTYIQTEVVDFESYAGGCQSKDVDDYLRSHNFHRVRKDLLRHEEGIGSCHEVAYKRTK